MALHAATVADSDKLHLTASGKSGTLCGKDYSDLPLTSTEDADWCKTCADAGSKLYDAEQSDIAEQEKARLELAAIADTEPALRHEDAVRLAQERAGVTKKAAASTSTANSSASTDNK